MDTIDKKTSVDWEDLIRRIRNGDDWRAEDELFKRSMALLWAIYWKRWHGIISEGTAEDIIQESYINARKNFPGGCFRAYLIRTFRNAVFDWLRRPRREKQIIGKLPKEPATSSNPETELIIKVEKQEKRRIFLECMKSLLPWRKLALQLWLQDLSNDEIEQIIPGKSVKDLVSRAKKDMHECAKKRPMDKE
jgi:RNA polymerase sigma factor (sigma-70 family)